MMDVLKTLYDEVISFLGIGHVVDVVKSGDYSSLLYKWKYLKAEKNLVS